MIPKVTEAKVVDDFILEVRFEDGVEGLIDLSGELDGEVFAPLKDPKYFRQVKIHPDFHTLVWPNEADFAPEFLYDKVRAVTT